ncbi:MAG TPA: hypothetical protein VIH28_08510 [Ignavibacteriaceae bacterium]
MKKKEIEKIVKKQTMIHLPHIHPYTVMDFEKGLVEALHQALSMSGVAPSLPSTEEDWPYPKCNQCGQEMDEDEGRWGICNDCIPDDV